MTEPLSPQPATESGGGSPVVALAYVGAAILQLLFLKGCAVYLELEAFGAVQAAFCLSFGASFLAMALRAASATRVAHPHPDGHRPRFDRLAWKAAAAAAAGAILLALFPVTERLDLPSPAIAALMPVLVAAAIVHGVSTGTVLGSERDRRFAALVVFEPVLRCLLAALLLSLGVGADGPGPVAAMTVSLAATAGFGRFMFPPEPRPDERPRRRRRQALATPAAVAAIAAYGVLLGSDVLLARLTLSPDEAARYAGVAAASRFLVLLPFPLSLLLLARLRGAAGRRAPVRELARALGGIVVGDLVLLLVVNEFGRSLLDTFLAPERFDGLGGAYSAYAIAAALYGIAQVLLIFGVALDHVSLVLLPSAVAIVQVPIFLSSGNTLEDCVTIVQTMALLLVFSLAAVVLLPRVVRELARRARDRATA